MNAPTVSSSIRLRWLGQVPYQEALDLMRAWTAARHQARKAAAQQPPTGSAAPAPQAAQADDPDADSNATRANAPEAASSPAGADGDHALPPASRPQQQAMDDKADNTPSSSAAVTTPAKSENSLLPALSREWPDLTTAAEAGDEIWLLQHPPVFTLGMNSEPGHLLAPGDIPVVPTERGGQVTYHGPGQIMAYLMLDLRTRKLGIRVLVERIEDALIACLAGYGIKAIRQEGAPGIYVHPRKPASQWPALPGSFSIPGGHEGMSASLTAAGPSAALPRSAEVLTGNEGSVQKGSPSAGLQQPASGTPEKDTPPAQRDAAIAEAPHLTPARAKTVRHLGTPAANVAKIASIGLKTSNGFSYHGLALNGQMDLSPFLRINPCGFHHLQMTDVRGESASDTDIDLERLALNLGQALRAAIER